jgi:hypothetical protein
MSIRSAPHPAIFWRDANAGQRRHQPCLPLERHISNRGSVRCGLTEVTISMDAARPETYRRVRRGGQLEILHGNQAGLRIYTANCPYNL